MSDEGGLLRTGTGAYTKSEYAIERNPWPTKEVTDAAMLLRGTLISAYASIETRLADVAIRASKLTEYAGIRTKYPYNMDGRFSFLRRVFSEGPLAPQGRLGLRFLDRLEHGRELRHLMAHAHMKVYDADWGATFEDIISPPGGELFYRKERIPLRRLEREAWRAVQLSRLGQRLHWRLGLLEVLPPSLL